MTATSPRRDRSSFQRTARAVVDRCVRTDSDGVTLRLAGEADLPAMCAMNASAIAEQRRDGLFMPMPESFLAEIIRNGIVLILERDGKLLGYSVATPVNRERPAFITGVDPSETGLLFGTAISPILRGQGRQSQLIRLRQRIFEEAGFISVQSTVSPFNTSSLCNLISSGFQVLELRNLLDGHPRFLLQNELRRSEQPSGPSRVAALPEMGDLSEHRKLLADGFIANGIRRGDPSVMLYTKRQDQHSQRLDS